MQLTRPDPPLQPLSTVSNKDSRPLSISLEMGDPFLLKQVASKSLVESNGAQEAEAAGFRDVWTDLQFRIGGSDE